MSSPLDYMMSTEDIEDYECWNGEPRDWFSDGDYLLEQKREEENQHEWPLL